MNLTGCEDQFIWKNENSQWEKSSIFMEYRRNEPNNFQACATVKCDGEDKDYNAFFA